MYYIVDSPCISIEAFWIGYLWRLAQNLRMWEKICLAIDIFVQIFWLWRFSFYCDILPKNASARSRTAVWVVNLYAIFAVNKNHLPTSHVCILSSFRFCYFRETTCFSFSSAGHLQGGPKNLAHFRTPIITLLNVDQFSIFFHCQNQEKLVIILSLKCPPHPQCVATLPCEMSVS